MHQNTSIWSKLAVKRLIFTCIINTSYPGLGTLHHAKHQNNTTIWKRFLKDYSLKSYAKGESHSISMDSRLVDFIYFDPLTWLQAPRSWNTVQVFTPSFSASWRLARNWVHRSNRSECWMMVLRLHSVEVWNEGNNVVSKSAGWQHADQVQHDNLEGSRDQQISDPSHYQTTSCGCRR